MELPHIADDQQLIDYLLGLLPPEDAERLDEASIVDDDVAARLRAVEDDLVDAYVRGALRGDTAKRFEAYYLSSPLRRERVMFAHTFIPMVDRSASSSAPRRARLRPALRLWTFAVAAALLLATSSALLIDRVRVGRGLTQAVSERAALEQHARDLEQQNAALRARNAEAARDLARARQATPIAPGAAPLALVLMPQTRAAGSIPTVPLPSGGDRVALELRLDGAEFSRYRAELRDPAANSIIWRSGWTAVKSSNGRPAVQVSIPARILKLQHYSVDLVGSGADGSAEVTGSYAFEVVR